MDMPACINMSVLYVNKLNENALNMCNLKGNATHRSPINITTFIDVHFTTASRVTNTVSLFYSTRLIF